ENAPPAPAMTITRTRGSLPARTTCSRSSPVVSRSSAFFRSGRLIESQRTASRSSTRIVSLMLPRVPLGAAEDVLPRADDGGGRLAERDRAPRDAPEIADDEARTAARDDARPCLEIHVDVQREAVARDAATHLNPDRRDLRAARPEPGRAGTDLGG